MTSRVDMVALDLDDDRQTLIRQIEESSFSRLPVYEKRMDNILGVLYLNHYYRALLDDPEPDLRSLLIPPCLSIKPSNCPRCCRCSSSRRRTWPS